jgi:hypothetical protein
MSMPVQWAGGLISYCGVDCDGRNNHS